MQTWQSVFLGARELSRELSEFELQAFFTYNEAEREVIAARRQPTHRLGLALHIGFLRMCGRPLDAFRIEEKTRNGNLRTLSGSGQFLRTGPQRPELIWSERWRRLPVVYVPDFLNMGVGPIRTGIFNLADVALRAGIVGANAELT